MVRHQRGCRAFTDEPLADDDILRVLDAARFAPSAENSQPWIFVVVTDASARAVIGELTERAWVRGGRDFELDRLAPPLYADVDRGAMGGIAGAPVHVVMAGDTTATPGSLDSSLFPAAQNLLLASNALGLGSALTTLPTAFGDELRDLLGLPDHVLPVAVIPVGHPARSLAPPRRRPVAEVAHRGRYGVPFS